MAAHTDAGADIVSFIESCKQDQYVVQKQCQNPVKGQTINKQHELGQARATREPVTRSNTLNRLV